MSRNPSDRRKEEIVRLQSQIIREMAGENLRRVGADLWGPTPDETTPDTPPPGFPAVPDPFAKEEANPAQSQEKKEDAPPRDNTEDLK
ncbi:MAG: hypothetical protein GX810_04410 [Clostridiales bacterium]|nr:hypothetical protein [Clostridiales bacterium]